MHEHNAWQHMRKHLSSMADVVDGAVRKVSPFGGAGKGRPLVDVCEFEREVVVYAEVPGVSRENLSVTLKRGVLTIAGKEDRPSCEGCECLKRERGPAEFSRDLSLPDSVDPEAEPAAALADGLLTVRIAKREREEGKSIRVDVK